MPIAIARSKRPPSWAGLQAPVDGDAALGKLELRRLDRRTHAVARLAHPGVGEADGWNCGRPLPSGPRP